MKTVLDRVGKITYIVVLAVIIILDARERIVLTTTDYLLLVMIVSLHFQLLSKVE